MYFYTMKILVASTAGFCMGVRRAVDLALEHSGKSGAGVYTLGPLIHNNQTIEMLKGRRITALDESKPVTADATILIRAHGVAPDVQDAFSSRGRIIDGTCPKVKTVHRVIQKYRSQGYAVVIAGDAGHAEVVGLQGYAGDAGHLICSPEDVQNLPDFKKICLVSQTTFDTRTFDRIADRIRERYGEAAEVVVKKTICSATDKRQNETRELAKKVDAMIVVGGKNSANTKRLAKIAEESGAPTQWVETEKEISWEKIAHCKSIGITAGASTPNWMITRIVDYLLFLDQTSKKTPVNRLKRSVDVLSNLNVFVSTGAMFMYLASCVMQQVAPTVSCMLLSFLYFLSMYLWNSLTNLESTQHLGIGRYRFYSKHRPLLYAMVGVCIVLIIAISSFESKKLFYLMVFATLMGSVYHITIVPPFLRKIIRYGAMKDIPTSRDLFVALAWAIVLTFIPYAGNGMPTLSMTTVMCFLLIFALAYLRSLIFDLRDIEGDRIMGRETLVTIIGESWARKAILFVIVLSSMLCAASPLYMFSAEMKTGSWRFVFQIIPLFYLYIFMRSNREHRVSRSVYFNLLADGQFFISGLSALASFLV